MPYVETDNPPPEPERVAKADHRQPHPTDKTWQRETTYQMFQAVCAFGKCESNPWGSDRQQYEPDAWNALQGHLRHEHYQMVRIAKVKRTSTYEVIEE